jgi:hypothetical protein
VRRLFHIASNNAVFRSLCLDDERIVAGGDVFLRRLFLGDGDRFFGLVCSLVTAARSGQACNGYLLISGSQFSTKL